MNPVEENISLLISELKKNNMDKDQSLEYLGHVVRIIVNADRQSQSLVVSDFITKLKSGNTRYAEGFFGNWAKHHEEDQDVGC